MSENSKPTSGFIVFATIVLAAVTILIQRQLHQSTNIFQPVTVGGTLEQIDQQVAALNRQYDAQMTELIRRVHTELIALTAFVLVMFCVFFGLKGISKWNRYVIGAGTAAVLAGLWLAW